MYAWIALIFAVGYLCIALEHPLRIDKAATAILTAVLCWTLLALGEGSLLPAAAVADGHGVLAELRDHLGEIAEILFFLLGAMTIVELVDAHEGFRVITDRIATRQRVKLLWIVGLITFFLSAVLDNLTTTIVMVSLLRKLIGVQRERWAYAGVVVIAANAGGAWSPIGDVTTTMLWIGNQISTAGIVGQLFLPSLVCLLVPLLVLSLVLRGEAPRPSLDAEAGALHNATTPFERGLILALGLGSLLFTPVFKTLTHLPPYMGILLGLGVLWVATEVIHRDKPEAARHSLSVAAMLRRIDSPSVLFFLGILLAVSSLATAGHLTQVADLLKAELGNVYTINVAIGLLSAVIDNVPLVAGAMQMYPLADPAAVAAAGSEAAWLQHFVTDGTFWELLAYCAGTGGSCLIIGSAAGVAAMGMERINFLWYLKYISGLALLGYLGGVATYLVLHALR